MSKSKYSQNDKNGQDEYKLIKGEPYEGSDGTVHVLFPPTITESNTGEFVAWCRGNITGELHSPDSLLPLSNTDDFCEECSVRIDNSSRNPDFYDQIQKQKQ